MQSSFLKGFKSIFLIFCIFSAVVSCGGSGKKGAADGEKVSVAFNISGVFENADGSLAKVSSLAGSLYVGGYEVKSLVFGYESENASRPDKGDVDILSAVAAGNNRVEVELYPEVTYKFEIEAEGDNLIICRGSERAAIKLKGNTPVKLICALRTEVELNIDKKAEVLRLLPEKADNDFQNLLDELLVAIDNDMSVKDVVAAANLTPSTKEVSNPYYTGLVTDFSKLKAGNTAAYDKLKALIESFGNTAELREALRVLDDTSSPFPEIVVRPDALNFGNVQAGYYSQSLTVNILNLGYKNLDVSGITAGGGYNVITDTCASTNFSLGTGESCSVKVRLKSFVLGVRSGTLTINSNDTDEAQFTVPLSATVVQIPPFTVNKTIFNFSSEITGRETPAQTMTLTNTGSSAIGSIGVETTTNFRTVNNCGVLPAGSSCTIDIYFKPLAGANGGIGEEFELTASTGGTVNVYLQGYAVPKGTQMKSVFLEDTRVGSLGDENLAVCENGKAHALLNTGDRLIYAFFDGYEWYTSGTIVKAENGKTITNAAIGTDAECFPHAAYITDGKLYYATLKTTGGTASWSPVLMGTAHTDSTVRMVSANDGVYISFISADKKGLYLIKTDEPYITPQLPYVLSGNNDILDFDMEKAADGTINYFIRLDKGGNPSAYGSAYVKAEFAVTGTVWNGEHYFGSTEVLHPVISSTDSYLTAVYQDAAGTLNYYKNTGGLWSVSPLQVSADLVDGGFSAVTYGNSVRLIYKQSSATASVIKQAIYNGTTWNVLSQKVYEDTTQPFFMGGGAMAIGGHGNPMVLFDKGSELVSKVFNGTAWEQSSALIRQIGVSSDTIFDIVYDGTGSAVVGVIGDRKAGYGGGVYSFSLKKQNTPPKEVFTTEKYFVTGVSTAVDSSGKLHACFIYNVGTAHAAYFNSVTGTPVYVGGTNAEQCSVSADFAGNARVAFVNNSDGLLSLWNSQTSAVQPVLANIDTSLSFAFKYLSGIGYLLYNSPGFGSLHLKRSGYDFQVDSSVTYNKPPHYLALAEDSGGQIIAGLGGEYTDGSATSKLVLYDCDPNTSSCGMLYSEHAKEMISGLAMGINQDDEVLAAYYSGGEGVVLLEYPLSGGGYNRRVISAETDTGYYGNGIKLVLNPENGLPHLLYRNGSRLIYSTQELRPVLGVSGDSVMFPTATAADRTKIAELFIENKGYKPLTVSSVSFKNGNAFITDGGTCPSGNFTLGIGAEPCSVRIRFVPSTAGVFTDRLKIETNAGDKTVILTGGASGSNF